MGLGKKQEGRKESKKGGGSNWSQLNWGPNIADTSFFFRFFSITELQPMTGTSRRIPSPFEVSKKHTWGKNNKTVKEYWKQVWKIKKMAAETRRYFFWLSKTFSGNFLRAGHPSRVQVKFQGKQQQEKKCIYHGLCNLFFGVLHGMLFCCFISGRLYIFELFSSIFIRVLRPSLRPQN